MAKNHPKVLAAYNYTLPWFANIVVSISEVIWLPISQLAIFNFFHNWNPWCIVWSIIVWLLSVYSLFLIVGDETMQAYMLWMNMYAKGFS